MEPSPRRSFGRTLAVIGVLVLACAALLLSPAGAQPAAAQDDCPPNPPQRRPCPWTPAGVEIQPCTKGFCWSGGYPNPLACKQEVVPANAHRTDLDDVVCNDGYTGERDRCTGVLLRCAGKTRWWEWFLPSRERVRDGWDSMTASDAGVLERVAGAASLLGALAELILLLTGIYGLARGLARRLGAMMLRQGAKASLSAAGKAFLKMAKAAGEDFLLTIQKNPDLIENLPQLKAIVESTAKKVGEYVVKMLKEQGAKAIPKGEEMAGMVYEAMGGAEKIPSAFKETVFKMLNEYFKQVKWYDWAKEAWRV